jgi:putative ABC transport system permease protein
MAKTRLWARLFCAEALRALARHKGRSALTALGIMIGVAAVIWVVAIGEAGSARAQDELRKLGDALVWIEAGSRNVNGVRNGNHGTTSLTPEDAEAIRREVPLIKAVAENVDGNVQVINSTRNWATKFRGVSPEYIDVKRWQVADGAFFTADHVRHLESVVVIGDTVRKELFGAEPPVGQVIRVNNLLFQVIGVLAAKGQSATGQDQDDLIMLPWTTAQRKVLGRNYTYLDDILCSAVSNEAVNPAIDAVQALMRERHAIRPGADDDFNIRRPDEVIKAQISASRTLAILLIALASISLVVGGIGIMNVMLASVSQRTNEIGLRVAVGATAWAVQLQFLGEAFMLSIFGGVAGVLLSVAGASLIEGLIGWTLTMPVQAAALAIVCSGGVGIFFGFYPAWRASRLDPITALRSD